MVKLPKAADPKFDSRVMPQNIGLFRRTVPGPDTGQLILTIEYENMAAYGACTDFENSNPEWSELFAAKQDSRETLGSVQLLTEVKP
jgi:hypothetical protein